jgi:hypothetical protein
MQLRNVLVVVFLGLAACGDKATDDSGSDDTGGTGTGGSGGGTGGDDAGGTGGSGGSGGSGTSTSDQPPTMTAADAWCTQHETGEARWIWSVTGQADDPQGLDTLELVVAEGVIVSVDGAERARLDLACDTSGACSGSFDETEANAPCADATRTSFALSALDEDGNRSDPAVATGRLE